MAVLPTPPDREYAALRREIVDQIRVARVQAARAVNLHLTGLYWSLGSLLVDRIADGNSSRAVYRQLSADLAAEFPEMRGLSERNLIYMRAFHRAWPDFADLAPVLSALPWGHHTKLLDRVQDRETRLWYAGQAVEYGWSRAVLDHQIASELHLRAGRAVSNFQRTLPMPQSDLAQQLTRDPYSFDFLGLGPAMKERDLEQALIGNLQKTLMELGKGFAFIGAQVPIRVGDQEFRPDLLFYHVKLHCYVVFELKVEAFKPDFVGQIQFYQGAIDDLMRGPDDHPTIGVIICREKHDAVVEYALRYSMKPIGVAEYRLLDEPPELLRQDLPGPAELEAGLDVSSTDDDPDLPPFDP